MKSFAGRLDSCVSSVNMLCDELDVVLSKMSVLVQEPYETIMFQKQRDSDFAVMELAFELKSTLGLMERLVYGRVTRCKESTLSSNDFERICKAINRRGPLQLDEILTSHQNTENDYQLQQRGQVIERECYTETFK